MLHKIIIWIPQSKINPKKKGLIPVSFFSFESDEQDEEEEVFSQMISELLESGGNLKVRRYLSSWYLEDLFGNRHVCPADILPKEISRKIDKKDFQRLLFVHMMDALIPEWIPDTLH